MEIVNKLTSDTNIQDNQAFRELITGLVSAGHVEDASLVNFDELDASAFDLDGDSDIDGDDLRQLISKLGDDSLLKTIKKDKLGFDTINNDTDSESSTFNIILDHYGQNATEYADAINIIESLYLVDQELAESEFGAHILELKQEHSTLSGYQRLMQATRIANDELGIGYDHQNISIFYPDSTGSFDRITSGYPSARINLNSDYLEGLANRTIQYDTVASVDFFGVVSRISQKYDLRYSSPGDNTYDNGYEHHTNDPEFMEYYSASVDLLLLEKNNPNYASNAISNIQHEALKNKIEALQPTKGNSIKESEDIAIATLLGTSAEDVEFSFNSKQEEILFYSYFDHGVFSAKALEDMGANASNSALEALQTNLKALAQGAALDSLIAGGGELNFAGAEEEARFQELSAGFNPLESLVFDNPSNLAELDFLASGAQLDDFDNYALVQTYASMAINSGHTSASFFAAEYAALEDQVNQALENNSFDTGTSKQIANFDKLVKFVFAGASNQALEGYKQLLNIEDSGDVDPDFVNFAAQLEQAMEEALPTYNVSDYLKEELEFFGMRKHMVDQGMSNITADQLRRIMALDTSSIQDQATKEFWSDNTGFDLMMSVLGTGPDQAQEMEDRINILEAQRQIIELGINFPDTNADGKLLDVAKNLGELMSYDIEAATSDEQTQSWFNHHLEGIQQDLADNLPLGTISEESKLKLTVMSLIGKTAIEAGASADVMASVDKLYVSYASIGMFGDDALAKSLVGTMAGAATQAIRNGDVQDVDFFAIKAGVAELLLQDSSIMTEDYIASTLRNFANIENSIKQIDAEGGSSSELREHMYSELNKVKAYARGELSVNDMILGNISAISDSDQDGHLSNLEIHDVFLNFRKQALMGDDPNYDLNKDGVVDDLDLDVMYVHKSSIPGYEVLQDFVQELDPSFRVTELESQEKIYYVGLIDSLVQHAAVLQEMSGEEYTVHERAVEQKKDMLKALAKGLSFDEAVSESIKVDLGLDELNFKDQASSDLFFQEYGFNFNPNARSGSELNAYHQAMLDDAGFDALDDKLRLLASGIGSDDVATVHYFRQKESEYQAQGINTDELTKVNEFMSEGNMLAVEQYLDLVMQRDLADIISDGIIKDELQRTNEAALAALLVSDGDASVFENKEEIELQRIQTRKSRLVRFYDRINGELTRTRATK